MNKSLRIVHELLTYLERFSQETSKEPKDINEFILWLNSCLFEEVHTETNSQYAKLLDMELTFLLIMQNKYYKAYTKKALINSEINSPDSYSFLYHLNLVDSYRKMELINMHIIEPPSGIEIIKRLLKKELIEEFDDPDDKRAKRVRITLKGKKEVAQFNPLMQKVYERMASEMTLNEKLHVISYLRKLNDYHLKNDKEFNPLI